MSEPYIFNKHGHCHRCKMETPYVLYRQVFANATDNYVWQCSRCSSKNPGREPQLYIPKEWVARQMAEQDMERLPSLMPGLYDRCARCGNRGTESHHWAPVGIFGRDEADKWPRDYLCKDCHDQWHKLVTPQLVVTDGRLL